MFFSCVFFSASDVPPRIEDCSASGPTARHMILEAPGTDIAWGSVPPSQPMSTAGLFSSTSPPAGDTGASPAAGESLSSPPPQLLSSSVEAGLGRSGNRSGDCSGGATTHYHSLLWEGPADVKAAISIVQAPANVADSGSTLADNAPSSSCTGDGGAGLLSEERSLSSSRDDDDEWFETQRRRQQGPAGTSVPPERGTATAAAAAGSADATYDESSSAAVAAAQADSGSGEGGDDSPRGGAAQQERVMLIRITLPRLHLRMPPRVRAALSGGIRANILAGGFVGHCAENFPLDVASRCVLEDGVDGRDRHNTGAVADNPADTPNAAFSPPVRDNKSTSLGRSTSLDASSNARSRLGGAAAAVACELCGVTFEADLVARHRCAWCGEIVCRKCLHTQVR